MRPSVDVTERPETIEAGSNILTGGDPASILRAVDIVTLGPVDLRVPSEYQVADVSTTVVKLVLGHLEPRATVKRASHDESPPAVSYAGGGDSGA